ncbi:glycoside hydrolase family 16 protein, partial [Sporormia fimetaria CBS 119925]
NQEACSCYTVSSSTSPRPLFHAHHFFDFRTFNPADLTTPSTPQTREYYPDDYNPDPFGALNTPLFTSHFAIQTWSRNATSEFPIPLTNSPSNIYLSHDPDASPSHLTLRTSRTPTFQSTAELECAYKNMLYASLRMRARVLGSPGGVAGFFTFYNDTQESDIEILTRDPVTNVRYTNQPALNDEGDEVAGASQDVGGLKSWEEWREHRVDWLPGESVWWVDGGEVARSRYMVPTVESYLVLNMWSDGGEWSGVMEEGASAELQVEWIEMVFNVSGEMRGKECGVVCKVDGVKEVGTPEAVKGAAVELKVAWGLL